MIRFDCDYCNGCHPRILEALAAVIVGLLYSAARSPVRASVSKQPFSVSAPVRFCWKTCATTA